jgi:two-component system cell cycle response regulator DivK
MTNKLTILNVEDNSDNRLLIRRILEAEGYRVLEAGDANTAMHVIEIDLPDLILMDINMPEIDGYTLTRHLKNNPKLINIPIIALTANVMKGDRERTLAAGCDGYIQKPIDVDTLPVQISQYMKR